MKGKKFDAAEKHFLEKEKKLRKQIKAAECKVFELTSENKKLLEKNTILQRRLEGLSEMYAKALEYAKYSESDLEVALSRDKSIAMFGKLLECSDLG